MSLRLIRRAVALGLALITIIVRLWLMRLSGERTLVRRAHWLQDSSRRVLRSMDAECSVTGAVPERGLVVANHLSYLDIVVLCAAMPCCFVAKAEVRRWPYFGKAAQAGGTLFLDRSSLASAEKVAKTIGERLNLPIPVVLFPEGTSTDGTMRRFHARLFEPAVMAGAPVTAAAIRYVTGDGSPERELCWYGDASFGPHLVKTLSGPVFRAELYFGEARVYGDRRTAASETFAEVAEMRGGQGPGTRDQGLGIRD
jgi:lyso-ornithine lipid O-acyltransferase